MTRDELFDWLANRRVQPTGCSRCGRVQLYYYRDGQELPVGPCCVLAGARQDAIAEDRIIERLHALTHDCPAEGCVLCAERRS